jgi:hypothetical protein
MLRVFGDEDTEWVFDLQLDRFESDDEEIPGDLFPEDGSDELVEVHVSQLDRLAGSDVWQLVFLKSLSNLVLAPGFCFLLVLLSNGDAAVLAAEQ